jgi:NAD(P)-dependent dehydrogenase (short-subunit alcohol dehydrogenase family)
MGTDVSKAVLITGCSTGIGRATAQRLAAAGHRVYATARTLETIADLSAGGCRLLQLDVCDDDSIRAAVAHVTDAEGAVGVLVNNAGYGSEGPFEEVPMAEVRQQFETNVFGLVRLTQLALPGMRAQRWGKVVNISSMGGRLVLPGGAFYHATKFAVEAMSDALRFEVQGFGIHVIVVEPGAIMTQFGETAAARVDALAAEGSAYAEFRRKLAGGIRKSYAGKPDALGGVADDVARVIQKAITVGRPKTRYPVTLGARVFMGLRRWLPDRVFDSVLRSQISPPAPARTS